MPDATGLELIAQRVRDQVGDGEHVEVSQIVDLVGAVESAPVIEFVRKTGVAHLMFDALQVVAMLGSHISRGFECGAVRVPTAGQRRAGIVKEIDVARYSRGRQQLVERDTSREHERVERAALHR